MATFQFGERREVRDHFGRLTEIGQYALHVQCPWRFVHGTTIAVGSGDLFHPSTDESIASSSERFDWHHRPNRRDELLAELFKARSGGFIVRHAKLGDAGSCSISFEDDWCLELFPDSSVSVEHWRLFSTLYDDQMVVTGPDGDVSRQ